MQINSKESRKSSRIESVFESGLWSFRFIIIVAVLSLLLSSLLAFYLGVSSVAHGFGLAMDAAKADGKLPTNEIVVTIIASIDEFLLGIILFIISLGIYELFISKIDAIEEMGEKSSPSWLAFSTLEDLKSVLTKVIIIILMVYFFKSVVLLKFDTPLSTLYLAIGILLIAVANYLSKKKDDKR